MEGAEPDAASVQSAEPVAVPAGVQASTSHADALANLSKKYADQFCAWIDSLKQQALQFKDEFDKGNSPVQTYFAGVSNFVQDPAAKQALIDGVIDLSPVPDMPSGNTFKFVLETYAWASVCLIAASLGSLLGGYLLSPLIGLALSTLATVLIAYMAAPYWGYQHVKQRSATPDDVETKMHLLGLSFLIGLCNGHNLSGVYLYALTPPSFLLPASIAVMAEVAGPKVQGNRPVYLAASIGPAVLVYFVMALITGSFGFAYLLFTIVSVVIAVLSLQHTFYTFGHGEVNAYMTQLFFVVAMILSKALLTFLLGTTGEKYAEYKNMPGAPSPEPSD